MGSAREWRDTRSQGGTGLSRLAVLGRDGHRDAGLLGNRHAGEEERKEKRGERNKRTTIPQASSVLPGPQGINWGADSVGAADSELTSS